MVMFDVVSSSLNEKVAANTFAIVGLFLIIETGKLFLLTELFPAGSELTCLGPDLTLMPKYITMAKG